MQLATNLKRRRKKCSRTIVKTGNLKNIKTEGKRNISRNSSGSNRRQEKPFSYLLSKTILSSFSAWAGRPWNRKNQIK